MTVGLPAALYALFADLPLSWLPDSPSEVFLIRLLATTLLALVGALSLIAALLVHIKHKPLTDLAEKLRRGQQRSMSSERQLAPTEIAMLQAIHEGDRRGTTAQQLQAKLKLTQARTEHHLGLLSDDEFIYVIGGARSEAHYALNDKGNAYLVNNNLDA